MARLIDVAVEFLVLIAVTVALAVTGSSGGGTAVAVVYLFTIVLLIFAYPAILETLWRGRTLGKAALGLRVVTTDGAPIHFRHAAIRAMLLIVDGVLVGPVIGVVALLVTSETVRLGDLAAGTIVVRERSGARSPEAMTFAAPPGSEAYVASLDISGLTAGEYGLIRTYFGRTPQLAPPTRDTVAQQVARPIAQRLHHVTPPGMGAEHYLWCVAAAVQGRRSPISGATGSPGWGSHAPGRPGWGSPAPGRPDGGAPTSEPEPTAPVPPADGPFSPPG